MQNNGERNAVHRKMGRPISRSKASLSALPLYVVAAALALATMPAMSQVYTFETHGKEIDHASRITPLEEFGEFGDGTDFASGVTTFRKTLVNIRGNSDLRVAADYIVRMYTPPGGRPSYVLERDLPYIEGTHSSEYGWVIGYAPTNFSLNRCSDPRAVQFPSGGAATIRMQSPLDNIVPADYWDGNSLYTPDAGGGLLRPISPDDARPSGLDIRWATNEGWRFSCYVLPDGGEGFVGVRPNGDKYFFGKPVATANQSLQILSPNQTSVDGYIEVDKYRMYVARIEDRFGNWVNYGAQSITSSDGREIAFSSSVNLQTVLANDRQWVISGPTTLEEGKSFSITNPDGSSWTFAQTGKISPTSFPLANSCSAQAAIQSGYSGQMTISVTAESGAVGAFVFQPRRRGFSDVWFFCDYAISGSKEGMDYSNYMHFLDGVALVSRSVTGPAVSYSHTIDYGPVNACYTASAQPSPPDACTTASPRTRTTTITRSDGHVKTLTFGNSFFGNAGLLVGASEGGVSSTAIEQLALYDNPGLSGKRALGYDVSSFRVHRNRKIVTSQEGMRYSMEVPMTCGASAASACFDSYFRPTSVIRSTSPGP